MTPASLWRSGSYFARYARRATAVLARAGIRRATVIERQCREMSEVRLKITVRSASLAEQCWRAKQDRNKKVDNSKSLY